MLSLVKGSTVLINYLGEFPVLFLSSVVLTIVSVATLHAYVCYLFVNSYLNFVPSYQRSRCRCLTATQKHISASDVLKALEMIELHDLVEKLQGELFGAWLKLKKRTTSYQIM